jgi:hypothetical protein
VQVSGRHDGEARPVVWAGRLVFSYTGLGDMGEERRTDEWLANRLEDLEGATAGRSGIDVSNLLSGIADHATAFLRRPRQRRIDPRRRRHAFVAAGWARFEDEPDPAPYLALISNYHREGSELAMAQPRFDAYVRRLAPGQNGHVLPVGHPVSQAEIDSLGALLAATENDPRKIAAVLADTLRQVAGETGTLTSVLPRGGPPEAEAAIVVSGGAIDPDFAVTPT